MLTLHINTRYKNLIVDKVNSPHSLYYLAANAMNKAVGGDASKVDKLPLPSLPRDHIKDPSKVVVSRSDLSRA